MKKDLEIWESFKNGDKSALSYIYFQHYEPMFQYGIKFKNDADFVKDCIQDVFFNLIKSAAQLGSTDNIRFYLLKALKHKIIKEIGRIRNSVLIDSLQLEFDLHFSCEQENMKDSFSEKQTNGIEKALCELTQRQREAIYLRYENELEYEQICEIMNLQYDSARRLVLRAIQALRKALNSNVDTPTLILFQLFS